MTALLIADHPKETKLVLRSWSQAATAAWHACTAGYAILVTLLIVDLHFGGGVGSFSATLLYCGVVASIQFLIALFIGSNYSRVSKWIWLFLALSSFAVGLYTYYLLPQALNLNNADTVIFFTMMVLSFPLGLVGLGVFLALGNSIFDASPLLYLFTTWLTLFALGLIQWLWIFPRLIACTKKKNESGSI